MAHQKHAKLARPAGGSWGRQELAILGAPCGTIRELAATLIRHLGASWRLAYADADHQAGEPDNNSLMQAGAFSQLTNKITHYEWLSRAMPTYGFPEADLVLVNGNHFTAHEQIVWVHPGKSLEKKLKKLTRVRVVLLNEEYDRLPDYLANHLAGQDYITLEARDTASLLSWLEKHLQAAVAPLHGLVLVGGRSTRMQTDKSQLAYHQGRAHWQYLGDLLQEVCKEVYVSVRDEEQATRYKLPAITDKFAGLGPYGGILSAFMDNPNAAWLVLAVDLPHINREALGKLVSERDPHRMATCFIDRHNQWPEPLITIWEPRAYPVLLHFLSRGYSCPRKALINSDVHLITERQEAWLTNVNTPEEYRQALKNHG